MAPTGPAVILAPATAPSLRRVEYHLGTAISLSVSGVAPDAADRFFDRIEELEAALSRFRTTSQISRIAANDLSLDAADPSVREVLGRCVEMRRLTEGWFEHEPRQRSGDARDPILDPNALAKGWIVEEAALMLQLGGVRDFFVNAGGDVMVRRPRTAKPWVIGIQHPYDQSAVLGMISLTNGAVANFGNVRTWLTHTFTATQHLGLGDRCWAQPPDCGCACDRGPCVGVGLS